MNKSSYAFFFGDTCDVLEHIRTITRETGRTIFSLPSNPSPYFRLPRMSAVGSTGGNATTLGFVARRRTPGIGRNNRSEAVHSFLLADIHLQPLHRYTHLTAPVVGESPVRHNANARRTARANRGIRQRKQPPYCEFFFLMIRCLRHARALIMRS